MVRQMARQNYGIAKQRYIKVHRQSELYLEADRKSIPVLLITFDIALSVSLLPLPLSNWPVPFPYLTLLRFHLTLTCPSTVLDCKYAVTAFADSGTSECLLPFQNTDDKEGRMVQEACMPTDS